MEKLQSVFDFLWKVVDKYGTKSLVACVAIAAIYYLTTQTEIPVERLYVAIPTIGLVALVYFVVREIQERRQQAATTPQVPEEAKPEGP